MTNNTVDGATDTKIVANVGWFACNQQNSNGTRQGSLHGVQFLAGYAQVEADLVVDVAFDRRFSTAAAVFGGIVSIGMSPGGHLRLLQSDETEMSMAIEYDSCEPVHQSVSSLLGWMALPGLVDGGGDATTRLAQQPTLASDVAALLQIGEDLRLPGYLRWHRGSDP
eukprot:SAG22_NODE_469_length_10143_cov_5.595181_6_plen_167_part_00